MKMMNSAVGTMPLLALVALLISGVADAQPFPGRGPGPGPERPPPVERAPRGWAYDGRHAHDRFYPAPGMTLRALPPGYRPIPHAGRTFYFHDGIWYRPQRFGFAVVAPPIGAVIYDLPDFATRVWIGGVPYYYLDRTYYVWDNRVRGYVVTSVPDEVADDARNDSSGSDPENRNGNDLFVYPAQGQSQSQQDTDRYECHRWAADQSGFDPTQPQGGLRGSEVLEKRRGYQRAETACLQGRGYTVK